jgi:hypothetical protein
LFSVTLFYFGIDINLAILILIVTDTVFCYLITVLNSKTESENFFIAGRRIFKNFFKVEICDVFIVRPLFLFFFIPMLGLVLGEIVGSIFADIVFWIRIYYTNMEKVEEIENGEKNFA